ncbi:MAG: hypothetical protein R3F07_01440 [Opitutaceae bacterium]
MKHTHRRIEKRTGAFLGATLLVGLVCAPLSWAYVDENLFENTDGLWFVTPATDPERDADTVQYVVDSAAEGDVIYLRSGTFDFGTMDSQNPENGKEVTVSKRLLYIIGATNDNVLGEVEEYLTTILANGAGINASSNGVSIEGIRVSGGSGGDRYFEKPRTNGQMMNMSVRVALEHACKAIPGFVIGTEPRMVLIRAVGPGLAPYDVPDTLENPRIAVFQGDKLIAENCDWCKCADNGARVELASKRCGAFLLESNSLDAALVVTLEPGVYTVKVCDEGEGTGEVLLEVYGVPAGVPAK